MDKSGHVRANSPGETESRRALAGRALGGRDRRKRPWDTATRWNKSPAAPSGLGKHTQGHLCLPGLAEHGCPLRCPQSTGAIPRSWQWSGNTHIPTGGPGPLGWTWLRWAMDPLASRLMTGSWEVLSPGRWQAGGGNMTSSAPLGCTLSSPLGAGACGPLLPSYLLSFRGPPLQLRARLWEVAMKRAQAGP